MVLIFIRKFYSNAKNSFFVVASTYFTLILEVYFPFLVWFKQTKPYFLIGGLFDWRDFVTLRNSGFYDVV